MIKFKPNDIFYQINKVRFELTKFIVIEPPAGSEDPDTFYYLDANQPNTNTLSFFMGGGTYYKTFHRFFGDIYFIDHGEALGALSEEIEKGIKKEEKRHLRKMKRLMEYKTSLNNL